MVEAKQRSQHEWERLQSTPELWAAFVAGLRESRPAAARALEVPGAVSGPAADHPADPVADAILKLHSTHWSEQRQGAQALARTEPDDRKDQVVKLLLSVVDGSDIFLTSDALKALQVWITPEVVPGLIPKLRDDRIRDEVIQTLGKLRDPRAAAPLAVRLGDDRFGRAVRALIAIGPPAEAAVIEQLKNPDPGARKRACEVLKEIGGMDSLIFMRDAKPDPDTFVRWAAQDAIKAIVARVGPPPPAKPATKGARRRSGL
jgi:HEAT repeat protein